MWNAKTREQTWAELARPWDVIIIGGGITGAGILRQAVMAGLRAVLLEAEGETAFLARTPDMLTEADDRDVIEALRTHGESWMKDGGFYSGRRPHPNRQETMS